MQGLSTVEKPNRDFCHQLQDVGQTGLITVNKNADSPEERKWSFVLSTMDGQSGGLYTSVADLLPVLLPVVQT
jgi:hypothetical protein